MKTKATISKKELCDHYGVSDDTLARWIEPFVKELIKKFGYKKNQQIFTIAQANFLYDKLGK